jgi:hypothetical protein
MPASISQPPIPVPDGTNTVQVLSAIRNALIALTNTDAGRSSPAGTVNSNSSAPQPSQFVVTQMVIVPVTYGAVTIPQLKSLTLLNSTTNETWSWTAPAKMFTGGVIGAAL